MSDGTPPEDYDIGYGKPPARTRFKPGRSGNPKGRPKAAKNLKTELQEELLETVAIKESGKTRKVSKQRAVLKSLMAKAVHGDVRAIATLVNLFLKINPEPEQVVEEGISESDEAILRDFLARQLALKREANHDRSE